VLSEKRGLLGDWLFSHLLFRDNPKNGEYPRTFKPLFESTARETGCPPAYLEELKLNGAAIRALLICDQNKPDEGRILLK